MQALFDQYLYIIMTLFDNYSEDEFGEVINSYENSAEYIADIKAPDSHREAPRCQSRAVDEPLSAGEALSVDGGRAVFSSSPGSASRVPTSTHFFQNGDIVSGF